MAKRISIALLWVVLSLSVSIYAYNKYQELTILERGEAG